MKEKDMGLDGTPVRFFVTDGEATVGPVEGELLIRGIHSGKVPLEALVWSPGWERWRTVVEYAADTGVLPSGEKEKASSKLARVSDLSAAQLPSVEAERQSLADAADVHHAARQMLHSCASLIGAECGWVHVLSRENGNAMVTHDGLGPRAAFGIGRSIDTSDQALRAARTGRTVLSEPIPGVVGSATAARIIATGISPTSVLMTPVLCGGNLLIMLELGIASRASGFSARDAALCEQVARDLSAIARKRNWHR